MTSYMMYIVSFFFSSRRRHTRWPHDWSSDVCSSDLGDGSGQRPELDWAARVQRLEAEVDGLRRAMRSRAIIEQAKGFLSAALRSEERRVGKECRNWGSADREKNIYDS